MISSVFKKKIGEKGEPYLLHTEFYSNCVWPIVVHFFKKKAHKDSKFS